MIDAIFNHRTFTSPPPVTAISYLTKIGSEASKGNSLYFPLWPLPPAAGVLCELHHVWKGGRSSQCLRITSLENRTEGAGRWKPCSSLCFAAGPWRTQDTGYSSCLGRTQNSWEQRHDVFLKGSASREGGKVHYFMLHFIVKLCQTVVPVLLLLFLSALKAEPDLLGNDTFKTVSPSLSPHCCSMNLLTRLKCR